MRNKFLIIMVLSLIAFINACYLSYKAYFVRFVDTRGLTSFCDVSGIFSCTEVLRSDLSQVFGISFPWVALFVYPVLFGFAFYGYKNRAVLHAKIIAMLSFLGILFNCFILYREAFLIHAFCLLCLLCAGIIVSIFITTFFILNEKE